nr:sulfotransferase [Bacteroidota bacterium]
MGKHVLVTGSHRSGSTWTGRVIAKANNVRYVHEPFNLGDPKLKTPFRYWFSYANGKTAREQKKIKRYLVSFISNTSSKFLFSIFSKRSLKALYAFAIDFRSRRSHRTVIKDPIALMSADWIYENLNWDVVVIIRHPAAFIASLKVKNWQFNFKNLQEQSALIAQRLTIF